MIQFILNDITIKTPLSPGITLLDFIRYEQNLYGTKIGCREGDCGACTVLTGEMKGDDVVYRSVTSCLMPLGNAQGKHIVTVEGFNFEGLNPVQQAMADEGATQCGFCTPGFVVSLAGFCIQDKYSDVVASVDGNICRCTGYKSIERAAHKISELLRDRGKDDVVEFAVKKRIIPEYFLSIKKRLRELSVNANGLGDLPTIEGAVFVGGGTDLYVQKHEEMTHAASQYLNGINTDKSISKKNGECILSGSATVTDMMESELIGRIFPSFSKHVKLVSSTQIRNMATIGGNFVNASPIGDFTVFFLALNASINLTDGKHSRKIKLRDFYKGYKKLDRKAEEFITEVSFRIPEKFLFNFEKVSKRTNLDIASVNSAMAIVVDGNKIERADISAGGVGPIPMYLRKASAFLSGKTITEENIDLACVIAGSEISPISDARGSATYKKFLLQQLIRAHFVELFPAINPEKFERAYEEH